MQVEDQHRQDYVTLRHTAYPEWEAGKLFPKNKTKKSKVIFIGREDFVYFENCIKNP